MPTLTLALDRALPALDRSITVVLAVDKSMRRTDGNGFLHVGLTNISKSNICPYYGWEIPGSEEMGLDPKRVYQMWRHPEELAKGAHTVNNLPLLDEHIVVTASSKKRDQVAGTMGSEAVFDGEYLQNSMAIWWEDSINRVLSNAKKELSCAYTYRADMSPGVENGVAYDGIMRDIAFNHVALVKEGRAGPDVVVADGKLGEVRMKFSAVKPILAAKFAVDAALNTASRLTLFAALDAMEKDCEAEDEDMEETEAEEKVKAKAEEMKAKDKKRAKDKVAKDKAAKDASEAETEEEKAEREAKEAKDTAKAMDAAIKIATDQAVKDTVARIEAVAAARDLVRPIVGEVHGLDSATAIYKFALDAKGVDVTGVHESAYPALLKMIPTGALDSKPVFDSASRGRVATLFPALARYA